MADRAVRDRRQIEAVHVAHVKKMEAALFHHMRIVALGWQMRYPKRKLAFVHAMGSSMWLIDDEPVWWDTDTRTATWDALRCPHSRLLYNIFLPLIEAEEWYLDMSRRCDNITIDDITLTPIRR